MPVVRPHVPLVRILDVETVDDLEARLRVEVQLGSGEIVLDFETQESPELFKAWTDLQRALYAKAKVRVREMLEGAEQAEPPGPPRT